METIPEIPILNLEETTSGGNESVSSESVTDNNMTVSSVVEATKDEKNLIREEKRDDDIDYKSRIKRHTEKENEIVQEFVLDRNQVRREIEADDGGSGEGKVSEETETEEEAMERTSERHPADWVANSKDSTPNSRFYTQESPKQMVNYYYNKKPNKAVGSSENYVLRLQRQNFYLLQALKNLEKTHMVEKKRFREILLGIDKALSTLPVRLEKIRVRNQRNLSMINSTKLQAGDSKDIPGKIYPESADGDMSATSQESNCYLSSRMKCLLKKIKQLNELVNTMKEGNSSPIELLVNSELFAMSLLKKEIKSTKKQIDDNKTDTEMDSLKEESLEEDSIEDSLNQMVAKYSNVNDSPDSTRQLFSNELNKAKNFKIFENHVLLQEEAMNLLTRKIKETEDALLKEIETKEGLKRENESMAKEISRLRSLSEGTLIDDNICRPEMAKNGSRPYKLIKELKVKLEEKEKSLMTWKSKYSRLEKANSNKNILLENEKKKNSELEGMVNNLKNQNKNFSSNISSLQYLNRQMKEQMDILRTQLQLLADDRLQMSKNAKSEKKQPKMENEVEEFEAKEAETVLRKQLEDLEGKLRRERKKNDEYFNTFKNLLSSIFNFGIEREFKHIKNPSYSRVREILNITPCELEVLYSSYAKESIKKELEDMHDQFKSIVEEEQFSLPLSSWFFDVVVRKLLASVTPDTREAE